MVKLFTPIGLLLAFTSTAAAAAPAAKSSNKPPERQYCLQFEDTGSHIARTECRTKSEWMKLGVNVDELGQN